MAIQKGTGFTNLNRILQANKGSKLGQTVSGGIQGQVSGLNTQVKSAQEQFQEEAEKNRLDTGASAQRRGEILGRFAPSTGASNLPQAQTPSQPTQPTTPSQPAVPQSPQVGQPTVKSPVSEDEIKEFTKFRTGTYAGPKELKDTQTLFGRAAQTEQLGELSRSEGGRQELLRRFVGGAGYTPGQRQLDVSVLGREPGQLGQSARQAMGSENLVSGAAQQASGLAKEYVGRAKGFGEETGRMVGETKAPLSTDLDTRVAQAQQSETTRLANLKSMQDMLSGTTPELQGLDKNARMGLALQKAKEQGYLSDKDADFLLGAGGKTGLLQRGMNLGLDTNQLLTERIKNQIAQNVARTGVASDEDIAKLNALDRLGGKQGTDLEFLEGRGKYQAGKTGFDLASLEDYINKTEAERAGLDKDYAGKLAQDKLGYLDQAKAYGAGAMGNIGQIGSTLTDPSKLAGIAGLDLLTGGDTGAQTSQATADAILNSTGAVAQGENAVYDRLLNLKLGGKSLADTPVGQQLAKYLADSSKLENNALGGVRDITNDINSGAGGLTKTGLKDITSGNIGNIAKNIAGASGVTSATKTTKNVGKAVSNAVKKVTGGGIKISDEDLKEDIDYDPKDIQGFMDRIKPAAYNYKEEIKNSPMASKNRELGVMAQDLEKSKLGKEAVKDTEVGKVVDYDNLEPKMLASIAALNKRLKELESKK